LTREKRIEDAEKRKEGQFYRDRMRGRLRVTRSMVERKIDRGNYSLENQGSKIIEGYSNDDDVASQSERCRKVENGFG